MTVRLEAAESLAEQERKRREMSESITAAAEKRIQELEEILVDVETNAAKTLKEKRRIAKLQDQVKELRGELDSKDKDLAKEQVRQEQLIADVGAAQERISVLAVDLEEAGKALASAWEDLLLAGEQVEKARSGSSPESGSKCREADLQQELERSS